MIPSIKTGLYCPVNKRERDFYVRAIAKSAKRIKTAYRKQREADLLNPYFRETPRQRKMAMGIPHQILSLIDTAGFYVETMPGHYKENKEEWIRVILNQWKA